MQSSEEMVKEKSESFRKNLATTERKQDSTQASVEKKVSLTLLLLWHGKIVTSAVALRALRMLCSQVVTVESWSEFLLGFIVARNELRGNISRHATKKVIFSLSWLVHALLQKPSQ
jgi:hypothetical protein